MKKLIAFLGVALVVAAVAVPAHAGWDFGGFCWSCRDRNYTRVNSTTTSSANTGWNHLTDMTDVHKVYDESAVYTGGDRVIATGNAGALSDSVVIVDVGRDCDCPAGFDVVMSGGRCGCRRRMVVRGLVFPQTNITRVATTTTSSANTGGNTMNVSTKVSKVDDWSTVSAGGNRGIYTGDASAWSTSVVTVEVH